MGDGAFMSDIKLFTIQFGRVSEMARSAVQVERSLQTLFEANLEAILGVRFLASELSTGPVHGGRIDTLGLDEDGCPVVVEYKRHSDENVISQGLYYLHWLLDHKGDFERLVHRVLGNAAVDTVDWTSPRLLCIAGDFNRYDEHAVKQINRTVELLRYRRFGEEILMLEVVYAPKITRAMSVGNLALDGSLESFTTGDPYQSQRMDYRLANAATETRGLFHAAREYLVALGEDVRMKELKCYVAFKRIKNFACVEVHPKAKIVTAYLKVDPDSIVVEPGFTRDVRKIGHFGTGELEVTMKSLSDFARAQPLMQTAYKRSWLSGEPTWNWNAEPALI